MSETTHEEKKQNSPDMSGMIGISKRFAVVNKLITRDLNDNTGSSALPLYSKDDITRYLKNPASYQKQLRKAILYIYGASPHFRRLIQYFVGLSDLSYVVAPYRIDPATANKKTISKNYRRVLNAMSSMNVKSQFSKILTTCLRDDVFYGTIWATNDNITIQQLPSDYCAISAIEGNVPNVSFDLSYFTLHPKLLKYYPNEIQEKYEQYKAQKIPKWCELESPNSFAIKCNTDILEYPLPPFAGILREVYDLEDYRQLKMAKTTLENYAMLVMTIGLDKDGNWQIDLNKAKEFWQNLDAVLPDEIGSILTPFPISKISFERTHTGDTDTIADAEQNLFSAAGVSSLLFNNEKASANALVLSIKADQAITYGVVKNIEDAINRYIQAQSYGKNFKITFLDCSPFNRKEVGDMYLKACQYGVPMVSYYCASQGLGQAEMDSMNFLENDVLNIKKSFIPLQSSATQSSDSKGAIDEGGAPTKDIGDLSESGEEDREVM